MSEEKFIQFVLEHEGDEPERLLLSAARWPQVDVRRAARIIAARRKLRDKVPSWHAFPALDFPASLPLEQCSSEETAQYKQAFVPAGGRVADLTGGLGVDSWAMSAVADCVDYCERDAALCAAARHNFPLLGAGNIAVHEGDGIAWLEQDKAGFDLIYLDPARRGKAAQRVYEIADCEPNLLVVKESLLRHAPLVLAKISPMADISRTLKQLPEIRELHIVAAGGEVKELLLLLGKPQPVPPLIVAAEDGIRFSFHPEEEPAAAVRYAERMGKYLLQPARVLRKAGAFRLLSQRYGVAKLAPSTQLYTVDAPVEGFPGKCFAVEEVIPWNKAAVQDLRRRFDRLELTALNFPLATDALRQRLGIPGGGSHHLFATTIDKSKILILCTL